MRLAGTMITMFFAVGAVGPLSVSGQSPGTDRTAPLHPGDELRAWVWDDPAPSAMRLGRVPPAWLQEAATPVYARPLIPVRQARDRSGVPFMVAGGIAFVAGAIVGGDGGTLLMLGGAGFGAYGAYRYFGGGGP